jgi:fucose permease
MLTVIASMVIFIYGMLASMLGSIVPSLAGRLGLTDVQISYLALGQGIGLAATSVWAGALMDRSGKKIGIALGLLASIVGLIVLANSRYLVSSVLAMAILGVGGALVIVGANAVVNDVSGERKASALNVLNLFVGLGGMATPFLAGNLLKSDSTKVAYCGVCIAVFALVLTLFTPMQGSGTTTLTHRSSSVFFDKALYILSLITFLYTACEFAMWNWLPRYLVASGIPTTTALNILSLGFASGMLLGRLGAARILGSVSPFAVTLVASISMGITTWTMLHARNSGPIACIVFLAGIAMAPVFPTTIAIVGRIFRQCSGTAIGFAITCGFSGLVVSSPVIGRVSGSGQHGLGNGLLLLPVCSLVIAFTLFLFRKTLTADAEVTSL